MNPLATLLGPLFLGGLGLPELLVLLAIVVLLFGASKLPQIGRGLGEGIRNFKKGLKVDNDAQDRLEDGEPSPDAPNPNSPK